MTHSGVIRKKIWQIFRTDFLKDFWQIFIQILLDSFLKDFLNNFLTEFLTYFLKEFLDRLFERFFDRFFALKKGYLLTSHLKKKQICWIKENWIKIFLWCNCWQSKLSKVLYRPTSKLNCIRHSSLKITLNNGGKFKLFEF